MDTNEVELKNTSKILKLVLGTLNSKPVQEKYGEFFATLSPDEKVNFVANIVTDLAFENPFIMGALIEDMLNLKDN